MTRITILGLGEAGLLYATGLRDHGADVTGYDPFKHREPDGVRQVADLAAAVVDADVVISLVGAASALAVAAPAVRAMRADAVYADFNTASPEVEQRIAALAAEQGVPMADVAVLAPVPRAAHRTELLAAGDGAAALAALLVPFGAPVAVLDAPAGEAARLRLMRSVFMKGLAALVMESLEPARAAGAEPWLRAQLAAELGPDGEALVDRLLEGSRRHAVRREHEVADAVAELEASGHPADMSRATLAWFRRLIGEQRSE
jgi:3-hydroxyisobutyrate dehydrogenase-like beta-hydroxyacid dehydrogenase